METKYHFKPEDKTNLVKLTLDERAEYWSKQNIQNAILVAMYGNSPIISPSKLNELLDKAQVPTHRENDAEESK